MDSISNIMRGGGGGRSSGGNKSRHYRDESDPLLGAYSQTLAESSLRGRNSSILGGGGAGTGPSTSPTELLLSPFRSFGSSSHQQSDQQQQHQQGPHPLRKQNGKKSETTKKKGYEALLSGSGSGAAANNVGSSSSSSSSRRRRRGRGHRAHQKNSGEVQFDQHGHPSFNRLTSSLSIYNKKHNLNKKKTTTTTAKAKMKTANEEKQKPRGGGNGSGGGSGYRIHRVSYSAQSHVEVLFRMYGSAFPNVFPFVVVNVSWTLLVHFLKQHNIIDWTFHSSIGHSFMGLLVSFLIVSRSQISYNRFMEYRKLLAKSYRICREVIQLTTVYTMFTQTLQAKQWRQQIGYETILLLRITMDSLLWSSSEKPLWTDEYYVPDDDHDDDDDDEEDGSDDDDEDIDKEDEEEDDIDDADDDTDTTDDFVKNDSNKKNDDIEEGEIGQQIGDDDRNSRPGRNGNNQHPKYKHFFQFRKLTHGRRSYIDEHFRAPITRMHILKTTLMEHPVYLGYKLPVNEYRDLVLLVSEFDSVFHGFRVLIFTPYPFPLVQMTRLFLFSWVYTLPLVLLKDYRLWSSMLIVVLVTFGFVGIEYVSMALDDPFGDDTNDIDEHGMALLVYEDIYMALYRTDGPSSAMELRERVLKRYRMGRAMDCYRADLKGDDIWTIKPHGLDQQSASTSAPDWSRNPPPVLPPHNVMPMAMPMPMSMQIPMSPGSSQVPFQISPTGVQSNGMSSQQQQQQQQQQKPPRVPSMNTQTSTTT